VHVNRKILIAPNSYKEVASSIAAAGLFRKYLSALTENIITAPLSDGGDGFLDVCVNKFNLRRLKYIVPSFNDIPVEVEVGYDAANKYIYIESAAIIGLKLVPPDKRIPMKFATKGLGILIKKIAGDVSVKKFIIGIGGTATNDLGLGMFSVLGLKLYNSNNQIVFPVPEKFNEIAGYLWEPEIEIPFEIIIDVNNPLLGDSGSAATYGPQKGFSKSEINFLDYESARLIKLFSENKINTADLYGSGGGLAAGIQIFLNPEITESEKFIMEDLGLKKLLDDSDIVITGEGSFDDQSFYGKGTGSIIKN